MKVNLLLIILSSIMMFSCEKEIEEVEVFAQDQYAINEEFIGNWTNGSLCAASPDILITAGSSDDKIIIAGQIQATIVDGRFETDYISNVKHLDRDWETLH